MATHHILVVDDNKDIRDLLGEYLQQHGYNVSLCENGEQMRAYLNKQHTDLILLDIMMPGEDGLSLCRFVRETGGPPVIMLTAMSEDLDCIVGLEVGAQDYVTKPFNPRVLLARIKTALRRDTTTPKIQQSSQITNTSPNDSQPLKDACVKFLNWQFNLNTRELLNDHRVFVPLSNAEFILLKAFVSHPLTVLSRDKLLSLTKGRESEPFDRSIDNQVSRLRKKIEQDPQQPTLIKTVWGGGYLFTAEVHS